jgi:hypothetical protein
MRLAAAEFGLEAFGLAHGSRCASHGGSLTTRADLRLRGDCASFPSVKRQQGAHRLIGESGH